MEISTILSGCPIAGNVSMLCMEYNRDVTLVSKGICISTLLSMISDPDRVGVGCDLINISAAGQSNNWLEIPASRLKNAVLQQKDT